MEVVTQSRKLCRLLAYVPAHCDQPDPREARARACDQWIEEGWIATGTGGREGESNGGEEKPARAWGEEKVVPAPLNEELRWFWERIIQ